MKKLFALSIAVVIVSASFGQNIDESKIPDAVKNSFNAKFANIKVSKWEKEDTIYSAEFLMDESATEAEFSEKGSWLNTEWGVPLEYTPHAIKEYLDSSYAGYKLKEINVMDFPTDGKLYVAEINKKKDCQKVYFSLKSEFKKAEKDACIKEMKCSKKKKKCNNANTETKK